MMRGDGEEDRGIFEENLSSLREFFFLIMGHK